MSSPAIRLVATDADIRNQLAEVGRLRRRSEQKQDAWEAASREEQADKRISWDAAREELKKASDLLEQLSAAGSPAIQDTYALIVRKLEAAQSGATELERVDIIDDIIDKAVDVYGQRLWSGTDAHTLQLYTRVARLPSTNTRTKLRDEQGLILNEAFHHQPSRATLLVCLDRGTTPMVLKIPGDDTAAEQEAAMHMGCHDIPGVVGPVELKVFGAGSRVSVRVDLVPQMVKAGCGILIPMMAASLDQFSQPIPESDVMQRAPSIRRALEEMHRRQIWHNDVKPANIFIAFDGAWKLGDFGSATIGQEPKEKTDAIWPHGMPASPRTDRIMLASTLLLIMHHREWRAASDVRSLHIDAKKIALQPLRTFVLQLLS